MLDMQIIAQALPVLMKGFKVTIAVAAVGIPIGLVVGTLLAYMTLVGTRPARALARTYIECVRNIPFLIIVYFAYFGLPKLGLAMEAYKVAVLTTAFYTGGYFSELMRAAILSVPRGQMQAAQALGMGYWVAQRKIIAPQLLGFLIPPTASLIIMMFKDTAIFSVITLPELTYQSNVEVSQSFAYVEILGLTALIYWVSSWFIDLAGNVLHRYCQRWKPVR
ncbi:membrane protein [Lampropedia cohaerens]|uniref:Membrane protein n=1 Tax=Lampropedia cohaerens TaxID=1610491 RepID=A0A0U1Q2U8_9BURK|nr:amino acid ABC transporter permease [Lampropedia cohaerens]KKW69066.1 membrane protein [Lampropedia cohaerens]